MTERKMFQIIHSCPSVLPRAIPFEHVAPFESRAFRNHHQTLDRLNERGGLSPRELLCLVTDRRLSEENMFQLTHEQLDAWFKEYYSIETGFKTLYEQ